MLTDIKEYIKLLVSELILCVKEFLIDLGILEHK